MHSPQTPGSQQLTFGSQSPYLNPTLRTVMKPPPEYILAGVPGSRGLTRTSSASAITLSCDEFGQQYRSLQEAAAARRSDLESIFSAYGMIYPFLPVDRELTDLPLTFTNPYFSVHEKLHHQVDRISRYFRNCAQQRDGAFRLDRLGELAYQDGRCDFYHQHASTLLEALRAVDLLKVVTANAAGNFVLTIDEASTSLPRQTLDEIMHNMMQNSYVLIGSVTPMSPVSWEYIKCTPRNVVTTMTAMQLTKMTTALLDSLSRFLHRDTFKAITGDITSGMHRSVDPTLMEIIRKLLLYEETEWKHALRRQYLKRSMFQPLNTTSTQQAEKIWQNRKQQYEIVFQNLAFPFLVEEIHELVRCLPQSLRRHADKLQEYYALHGFPSDISDVFQRLRSLSDSSVINPIGRPGSNGGNRPTSYSVSFAGEHRGRDRYRPSHPVDREYDVNRHRRLRNHRTGYDNGRQGDGHRRHNSDQSERSRDRSQYDQPPRDSDHYRSRSRSRSVDSRGSQRSDLSRESAHSWSRSPGERSSRNDERDHRGRSDRLDRDHRDPRGRASSLDLATRRLRERHQGLDRGRPDRSHPGQQPGRQRTPPASPHGNPSAELNAVQQPPPVKAAEPRRSQSPSQARPSLPGKPSPRQPTAAEIQEREKRRQALRLQQAKVAEMQADLDKEDSAPRVSVVIASGMHVDQSTSESLSAEPQMAGLHVGDCVLRRGELHKVVEIDNSLSPIACTVQNLTTGAVVATELPFLSLPKRESLSAERHSVLPAVSIECGNTGSAQVSPASAIKTAAAWVRLPAESRLRRQALLEQKAKRESINIPAAAKSIALQNMLRVHGESMHHISKINGRPATLVDPGAQVSASSDFDAEEWTFGFL